MRIIEYVRGRPRPKGCGRQACHREIDVTEIDIVEVAFDTSNEVVELPVVANLPSPCESRLVGAGGKQRSAWKFAEKTCGLCRDLVVERPARIEPDIKSDPGKDRRGWRRRRRCLSRDIGGQNWRSDQT